MTLAFVIAILFAAAAVLLVCLAIIDQRALRAEWRRLAALQPDPPARFAEAMVAGLPEPARRYLSHAIAPGTPLLRVATLTMTGRFSLGTRDRPDYRPMTARQILAAPDGFVWAMRMNGRLPVSGSDSGRWTRFGILGLIPVARLGGTSDHTRSAYGRNVAEAAIWTPAALLPRPGVTWEGVGGDIARVTVAHRGLTQTVDIRIDARGCPREVFFRRWSDANPDRVFRLQPFGAYLSDFREVDGYRLPFRVEAGNLFGTDGYFPFFIAEIGEIRFPGPCSRRIRSCTACRR